MAARLKLISHKLCPYVQRAVIALTEKGVAFERIDIDLANKPDWFLAFSPLGKTPVLQVGDVAIFESAVILEYLEETQPTPLHPADPLEARRASRLDRIRIGCSQRHRWFLRRGGRGNIQSQNSPTRAAFCAARSRASRPRHGLRAKTFRWSMPCSVRCSAISMCSTISPISEFWPANRIFTLAQGARGAAIGARRCKRRLSGAASRFP